MYNVGNKRSHSLSASINQDPELNPPSEKRSKISSSDEESQIKSKCFSPESRFIKQSNESQGHLRKNTFDLLGRL